MFSPFSSAPQSPSLSSASPGAAALLSLSDPGTTAGRCCPGSTLCCWSLQAPWRGLLTLVVLSRILAVASLSWWLTLAAASLSHWHYNRNGAIDRTKSDNTDSNTGPLSDHDRPSVMWERDKFTQPQNERLYYHNFPRANKQKHCKAVCISGQCLFVCALANHLYYIM